MPPSDRLAALLGPDAAPVRRALTAEHGVSLPAFVDHHVHLHLIDEHALPGGGIAGVVDLGGDPYALDRRETATIPHVRYAGAFLTAPGGYPSGRTWAPPEIVREVADASRDIGHPGGAETLVDEQRRAGASVIKVVLHADHPLPQAVLAAIVQTAHGAGLPVVAHVEGVGMTRRALDAGVDVLAHTPFSEALDDGLIAAAAASGQAWISTLDIHRDDNDAAARARGHLRAFAAAGGHVLYGTDLGNGDLPVGVNAREVRALLDAGLDGPSVIAALTDPWPEIHGLDGVHTFVPGDRPDLLDDLPRWLATARVVPTEELVHDDL